MRKHLGKARYASILVLAVVAGVLVVRLQFVRDGTERAAAMFPPSPTADLATALVRSGLERADELFEYLTELQAQFEEVARDPARWMPWNYREAPGGQSGG